MLKALIAMGMLGLTAGAARAELAVKSLGTYTNSALPEGLSGIAYVGGNQYYTVEDSGGRLYALTIVLTATGSIHCASTTATNTCIGAIDLEGIAWNRLSNTVYVSDENGATIREYAVTGGVARSHVSVPAVFKNYRPNYSLESLSATPDGRVLWTANEEALQGPDVDDGPLASASTPTVVRLQRWSRTTPIEAWTPSGQWAYSTDKLLSDSPWKTLEHCGVADLCVLPNGQLLVLERELSGYVPTFKNRIFRVDFAGADDIAALTSLHGARYTPVTRHLLWSANFGMLDNFEGLCLGPILPDGSYSLIMIADGDNLQRESLHALSLTVSGSDAWKSLEVHAGPGSPGLPVWRYDYAVGTRVECSVPAAVTSGVYRYTCTGWKRFGQTPGEGKGHTLSLTLTDDAVLVWQWHRRCLHPWWRRLWP